VAYALLRVLAHLVFVDDGILGVAVAFGAFTAGSDKCGAGLLTDDAGTLRVDQIGRDNQTRGNDDGDEDGAKVHGSSFNLGF